MYTHTYTHTHSERDTNLLLEYGACQSRDLAVQGCLLEAEHQLTFAAWTRTRSNQADIYSSSTDYFTLHTAGGRHHTQCTGAQNYILLSLETWHIHTQPLHNHLLPRSRYAAVTNSSTNIRIHKISSNAPLCNIGSAYMHKTAILNAKWLACTHCMYMYMCVRMYVCSWGSTLCNVFSPPYMFPSTPVKHAILLPPLPFHEVCKELPQVAIIWCLKEVQPPYVT